MDRKALRGMTVLVIAAACVALLLSPSPGMAQDGVKAVTVLVYMAVDRDSVHEAYAYADINEMEAIGSTADVNIVVQVDSGATLGSYWGGGTAPARLLIVQDENPAWISSPVLSTIPESSTGDPDTLVDFFSWGSQLFPAERYYVILWDHYVGSGWKPRQTALPFMYMGLCYDQSQMDHLTMKELEQAVGRIKAQRTSAEYPTGKNIELLAFDGGQAGLMEIAYQVKDSVDIVMFSQLDEPAGGYCYDQMLSCITSDPRGPIVSLVQCMISAYVSSYAVEGWT